LTPPAERITRVVAIDLDGTLLPGNSVSEFLARRLGHRSQLAPLEARYRAGESTNAPIAEAQAQALDGMNLSDIEQLLAQIPTLNGIAETTTRLRESGAALLIATVTWSFAARHFAGRFAFDDYSGTVLAERRPRLIGHVVRHFNADDKRDYVQSFCRQRDLDLSACIAIGDSRSDLPLFRAAGLAIALNATPEAELAADVAIQADDLRAVLPHIR